MAFDLPARRELPADVKERMRPDFAKSGQSPARRSPAPLAVAAGVALLIAGGVVVTQSISDRASPGHVRVVSPSSQDLARCRAALDDQNWQSTEMVVFGLRKVLHGDDGRFCELTRSKARVASQDFEPVALEEGSITYHSSKIIAGVPPKGATTAKAEQGYYTHVRPDAFRDGMVTENFFVVETYKEGSGSALLFDERSMPMPRVPEKSATTTDSFDSGDPDRGSLENRLLACVDDAFEGSSKTAEQLENWQTVIVTGLEEQRGVLLARQDDELAYCHFGPKSSGSLQVLNYAHEEPGEPYVLSSKHVGPDYVIVGRVDRCAKTVEVSDRDGSAVTAEVADGYFLAAVPLTDGGESLKPGRPIEDGRLHVVVRDENNEVAYEGDLK
jgi:hypothetical protein